MSSHARSKKSNFITSRRLVIFSYPDSWPLGSRYLYKIPINIIYLCCHRCRFLQVVGSNGFRNDFGADGNATCIDITGALFTNELFDPCWVFHSTLAKTCVASAHPLFAKNRCCERSRVLALVGFQCAHQ